jgi:mannose-6-phosphate isomerase
MQDQLRAHGAHIDAWYMCPFHEDGVVSDFRRKGHPDRKPAPGMIRRAMLDWPIRTMGSFAVGDRELDREAASNAGLPGFIVRPGELLGQVQSSLRSLNSSSSLHNLSQESAVSDFEPIIARAAHAREWLFNHALPLWWHIGFDPKAACFHERIAHDGSPVMLSRRIRVQARQTFVYAMAGRLGWSGPWREAVEAGTRVLLECGLRKDGGTIYSLDERGNRLDERRDLYDTAFVTFALAHAGAILKRQDCLEAASSLVNWTYANWSHPNGGFLEGDVVTVPPRRQNPHMHMLEALLALHEATGDALALKRAGAIVELFTTRFMSERWGALLEYFDEAWAPVAGDEGRISEPGHQFEWSWLLDRYRRLSGVDVSEAAHRIYVHGEAYGVPSDGYTVDEVWAEGVVRTPTSRLWPHTERIKANIIRVETLRDPRAAGHVVEAFDALMTYCDLPIPGLWRDRRLPDGSFLEEAAPASSFYHIILALSELIRVADMLERGG